jgi:hypothetical protein
MKEHWRSLRLLYRVTLSVDVSDITGYVCYINGQTDTNFALTAYKSAVLKRFGQSSRLTMQKYIPLGTDIIGYITTVN